MPLPAQHRHNQQAVVKMVKASDLSLRGGRRPTWQSRSTMVDNRKASANSQAVAGDCTPRALPRASRSGRHVASLLAMTRQGGAVVHQRPYAVELPCTRRSLPARARRIRKAAKPPTAAQGAPLQAPPGAFAILTAVCTDCKCVAGSGMPLPYTAFASAYPTKPTHQRSFIHHADRFFEDRRSSCSQF